MRDVQRDIGGQVSMHGRQGGKQGKGGNNVAASADAPSNLQTIIKLLLTFVIFVVLEEGFQKWVFRPYFRPDLVGQNPPIPKMVDVEEVRYGPPP